MAMVNNTTIRGVDYTSARELFNDLEFFSPPVYLIQVSSPISTSNNTDTQSQETLHHQFIWETLPKTMEFDYKQFINNHYRKGINVSLVNPFKSIIHLRQSYLVMKNGWSRRMIDEQADFHNHLHMGREASLLHSRQLLDNLNSVDESIELWDVDPVLPHPYVRLEKQLSMFLANPYNCPQLFPFPDDSRSISRYDQTREFQEYYSDIPEDTLLLCLEWYIDGFSRVYGKNDSAVGYYSSLLNTVSSFRNNFNNIWLWTLADSTTCHLQVADRFLQDLATVYEPFGMFNAQYDCWLNYAVRLCNCSFDTPKRNLNCSVYQFPSYHNCTKCEVQKDHSYLTIDELREKQAVIQISLERKMDYVNDEVSFEFRENAPTGSIYVRRSVERRMFVNDIHDGDSKIIHKQHGYKTEYNPYIAQGYDIFALSSIDLMHVLYSTSGHVSQFMRHIVNSASPSVMAKVSSRMTSCLGERFDMSDIEDWDCQKMERASHIAPVAFEGLIDIEDYTILKTLCMLSSVLSRYYVDTATLEDAKTYNSDYKHAIISRLGKGIANDSNFHALDELIYQLETKGPGKLTWTQRYERYHKQFKKLFRINNSIEWVIRRTLLFSYLYLVRLRFDASFSESEWATYQRIHMVDVGDALIPVLVENSSTTKLSVGSKTIGLGDIFCCGQTYGRLLRVGKSEINREEQIFEFEFELMRLIKDCDNCLGGCPRLLDDSSVFVEKLSVCKPVHTFLLEGNLYLNIYWP